MILADSIDATNRAASMVELTPSYKLDRLAADQGVSAFLQAFHVAVMVLQVTIRYGFYLVSPGTEFRHSESPLFPVFGSNCTTISAILSLQSLKQIFPQPFYLIRRPERYYVLRHVCLGPVNIAGELPGGFSYVS